MTSPLGISDWPKSEDNKKPENLYGELLEFGLTNGNPMEIVEAGVKDERKIKLKSSIVPHAQEAGYDELLGMILEKLQDSLNNPIIKDSFDQDHEARRLWENSVLEKASPKVREDYNRNAIQKHENYLVPAISLLESCLEGEAVDDLKNIEDRIPEALKSGKAHDLRNDNEDTEDKYGSLDFEGKLVVVKKTVN